MPRTGASGSDRSSAPICRTCRVGHGRPSRRFLSLSIVLAIMALAVATLRASDPGTAAKGPATNITQERLARDVKLLQNAGVATDGPGLVGFFRKQTLSDEQRRAIGKLIAQLGDDSFEVRERATQELKALGPVAVPALQQ